MKGIKFYLVESNNNGYLVPASVIKDSKFEININSLKIDFIQKRVLSYYKIKLIDQLKSIVIKFFIFFKNNFLILENEEVKI